MMTKPMTDRLTINELADALGMARRTVRRYFEDKGLRSKIVKGWRLIELSDFLEWANGRDPVEWSHLHFLIAEAQKRGELLMTKRK